MKRSTVLKLWRAFGELEGLKHDVRFSYFLAKNKVALKGEIESLGKAQAPSQLFLEFENKRVELAQKFSDRDSAGNPKIHNGQYVIYDKRDEFSEEMKKLKAKFKATVKSREDQIDDYNKMLDEDVEVNLLKVKFSQLPRQIESAFLEVFIEADVIEDDEK